MAVNFPPPPSGQPVDSWQWRDWFFRLLGLFTPAGPPAAGDGLLGQVLVSGGSGNPPVWTTTRIEQAFTSQVTVTVTHNFGRRPLVQVLDLTDSVMIPMQVFHGDVNTFIVSFSIPTSGTIIGLSL